VTGAGTGVSAGTGAAATTDFFFADFFLTAFVFGCATTFFGADFAFFFAAFATTTFFFAVCFLATAFFFALATGRFFALLFFAMVSLLLAGRSNPRSESSPEKVRCHLRRMLELREHIAYAAEQSLP
jgi:hypothetical protein